jgi:hypothetical protein
LPIFQIPIPLASGARHARHPLWIVAVTGLEELTTAEELLRRHGADLAQLLRGDLYAQLQKAALALLCRDGLAAR